MTGVTDACLRRARLKRRQPHRQSYAVHSRAFQLLRGSGELAPANEGYRLRPLIRSDPIGDAQ